MSKPDLAPYAARVVAAVKSYVSKAEAAMTARLDALEARLTAMPAPERGEPGAPGKDADLGAVRELVAAAKDDGEARLTACLNALEARLAAIPAPQKGEPGEPGAPGKDADMDAVRSMVQAEVCAQVEAIPPAKDGAPGKDGQSVHPDTVALMVREAADKVAAALPKPKDGRDGFNLEDIQIEMGADGRTLSLKFVRGEDVVQRDIRIPAMLYRGVWREGEHEPGDVVTWGGSAWHCNEKTTEKPGASTHWRLMVKEGRPGKDAGSDGSGGGRGGGSAGPVRFK